MLKFIFGLITITILALPNIRWGEIKSLSEHPSSQLSMANIFSEGGVIHGTVVVENNSEKKLNVIAMADFKLRLVNASSNKTAANVTTDIFGRYYFPKVAPNTYNIVWDRQNGWEKGGLKQIFNIKNSILYADQIKPIAIKGNAVFTGNVIMNNGSAAFFNEYYGVQSMPNIQDKSRSITQRTDVNGQFAISTRDKDINISLKGNINKAFNLQNKIKGSYPIKNTIPVLLGFELTNNSKLVKYPKQSEQLNLRALVQDLDVDTLLYSWQLSGAIVKKYNGNNIKLTMPKGEGTIIAELLVEDGKGGYISGRHTIGYGQKLEIFSGIVNDRISKIPVANADVTVNNTTIKTNENGHFRMLVPLSKKYTLLISKLGHTTYGQAFEQGQKGRSFFIRKMKGTKVNTNNAVILKDSNALLSIPKNSLVDNKGKLPKAALTANFSILDIANNEFPGDFIGRDKDRVTNLISFGMVEISFYDDAGKKYNLKKGAKATIELPVAGAKDKRILANAPKTIPIWTYNLKTGEWDKNGIANLDRQKAAYIGTLGHFSTINMDQPGAATCIRVLTDPELMNKYLRVSDVSGDGIDYATIKEVLIDNALSAIYRLPVNQKVRIEVLDGPGGTPIADVFIDVFDSAQPALGWVLNSNNEVQSGAALADLWPLYPYDVCPITINLKHQPNANPANPVTDYNSFLSYKGIGNAVDAAAYYTTIDQGNHRLTLTDWLTHNGYTIAPGSITYGTNADFSRYFNTAFLNNNDLGSGRDMHFLNYPDGTATAYVANYGLFNQNHDNADKALNRDFIAGDVIATVCMEWSPLDNAANEWLDNAGSPFSKEAGPIYSAGYLTNVQNSSVVKFFVYTQTALGGVTTRQVSANLDGYQNKFVPNLCNTCHGGSPTAPFTGTYFRELDYRSYKFSGGRLHPAITEPEKDAFQGQNNIVNVSPTSLISSPAIKELINLWYNDLDNIQQVVIPINWQKSSFPLGDFPLVSDHPERLYTNVVGKSCRTCHVAFDNGDLAVLDLGFDHYDEYLDRKGSIDYYTTNQGVMPHSVITHRNFWTDTELEVDENGVDIGILPINRANYLRTYTDSKWGPPF